MRARILHARGEAGRPAGLSGSAPGATFVRPEACNADLLVDPAQDNTPALPSPLPRAAIIVVDSANLLALQRCVHALHTQTDYPGVDLRIASLRSAPLRSAQFTGVRWVGASNIGLLGAFNRAIHSTTAEFVALVDSRCMAFDADWLRRLVAHAQSREVGLVVPAPGAVVLVARRCVLVQASGFDPSYEDLDGATVDLSLRIALHDLEHRWLPSVRVHTRPESKLASLLAMRRRRRDRARLCDAWQLGSAPA